MIRRIMVLLFGISITPLAHSAAQSTPQNCDVYIPDKAIIAQIDEYNACCAMHLPGQKPWSGDSAQLIATLKLASNGRVISMPTPDRMYDYKSYSPLYCMPRIPHVPLLSYVICSGNLTFAEQLAAEPTFVVPTDQYGNTALHYIWQYMQRFTKYNRRIAPEYGEKLPPTTSQVLCRAQQLFKYLAPLADTPNKTGGKPIYYTFSMQPIKFITFVLGPSSIDPENFESYMRDYLTIRWGKKRSIKSCSLLDITCRDTCARPTPEAFIELLATLHQSFDFKSAVWRALSNTPITVLFPTGTRTAALQKIADELHTRTSCWISQLLPADEQEEVLKYDLGTLYVTLLEAAQKIDAPAQKATWLLELYRSAFATDYIHKVAIYGAMRGQERRVLEILGNTLLQLGNLGIKPNVRLCPTNDNDTRTLFYAWLLYNQEFENFASIFPLLSLEEMDAEAALLQQSDEFTARVAQMGQIPSDATIPDDVPYAMHWRILERAIHNQHIQHRSLFELLLPRLNE